MAAARAVNSAMRKYSSNTHILLGFIAAIACVYVAGRYVYMNKGGSKDIREQLITSICIYHMQ